MNNHALIFKKEARQVKLKGFLDFSNILDIADLGLEYVALVSEPAFDFSEIKKANSAGIALMLLWWREATRLKKKIHWLNIPKNMLALIKVGNLNAILEVVD